MNPVRVDFEFQVMHGSPTEPRWEILVRDSSKEMVERRGLDIQARGGRHSLRPHRIVEVREDRKVIKKYNYV